MNDEYMSFNNLVIIEIKLERPYFHKLCAQDKAFNFKIPDLTKEEIQTERCDRIQSVDQLLTFIREVKTADEQESLLFSLLNRIRKLPDLSELKSLYIGVHNKKKDGTRSFQQLDYTFSNHKIVIS